MESLFGQAVLFPTNFVPVEPMQTLAPVGPRRGRITFFVPRWIPDGVSPLGLPYKTFPVMSSLARHGYEVDFFAEHLDGIDTEEMRASLARADGVAAWCAELNPGIQIPGILGFLDLARRERPTAARATGGGFFALTSSVQMNLAPLAEEVFGDSGVTNLVRYFDERLGHTSERSPRTSLEELYIDNADFVAQLRAAVEDMVADGTLLREDAERIVAAAKAGETILTAA